MDFMKLGTSLLQDQLGSNVNSDLINSALTSLLGGSGGAPDLGKIVSSMQGGGLGSIAESWLGDGGNDAISSDQIKDIFGGDKITEIASQLGTDEGSLLGSLTDMLPQMVDKSSQGGSLLDSVGGIDGVMNLAKKFF